ncbi:TRAP transporter substrate-binding protein [Albimonas pacifica]|uniref:TRAP-type C4-dicarboxylate transport system, substrate-binding protein n=1 Tax=Albimonas pacifica TaxID=1114924 RepID=A0A1I3BYA1_9RHOB|nr:TRAP transporter substrate-binding protein [Albimonas pacifica]SFH67160.1 TRAP-type C4-dicarboxylate transport system, substrate-binding protein [Albimonas pacifica]
MKTMLAGAALAALLGAAAQPLQAETVLRYSNWLPTGHLILEHAIDPFIAEVEARTEGRVRIETPPKVIGSVAGQYDAAVDGLADLAFIIMGYTPGRFPLSEVVELPFIGDDPEAVSVAYWRVYQERLERYGEFKGVKLLGLSVASPAQIVTRSAPAASLADLQGLKMRNPIASFIPAAEAMGTVPINKPISELYELAASGVVDGAFAPLDSQKSFNLMEVLPYVTLVEGGLFSPGLAFVMNIDSWNALDPADQRIVMEAAGETWARAVGRNYALNDQVARREMEAREGTLVQAASPELMADLHRRLAFVRAAWIEKATAAGVEDAAGVADALSAAVAAAK